MTTKFDSVSVELRCLSKNISEVDTLRFFIDFRIFMKEQGYIWSGETGQHEDSENGIYCIRELIQFTS